MPLLFGLNGRLLKKVKMVPYVAEKYTDCQPLVFHILNSQLQPIQRLAQAAILKVVLFLTG